MVGGGICGLATALGLKRSGHNVTIYERYPTDIEQGAGLIISANGHRILKQWGLDPKEYGMLTYRKAFIVDGKSLNIIKDREVHLEAEAAGEMRITTTRRDLRDMFRTEALKAPQQDEGLVQIFYDSKIVDYNPIRPAVQLADGTWKTADLVVGCNGIKSGAARYISSGKNTPAVPIGESAFRLAILTEQMRRNEMVRPYVESESALETTWFCMDRDSGRVAVWWACHFGETHAFDICIPDNENYASSEEWLAKCDKSVLLNEFKDWHPLFQEILQLADEPLLWKICAREPMDKLHEGKLVLLGDALHPMPPYKGQGSTQAIEDAAVLEICLKDIEDMKELPIRLQLLEDLRIPRVSVAQLASNLRFDAKNEDKVWKDTLERAKGYVPEREHDSCEFFPPLFNVLLTFSQLPRRRV